MPTSYSWQESYQTALLETDWTKMQERVQTAESEIHQRRLVLAQDHGGTDEERAALVNAMSGLRVLRMNVASWSERQNLRKPVQQRTPASRCIWLFTRQIWIVGKTQRLLTPTWSDYGIERERLQIVRSARSGLLGFIHSTESAHRLNIDAKEHSLNRHIAGLFAPFRQRDSPPSRILRESFLRMFLLSSIFRPTSAPSTFQSLLR